MAYVSGKIRSYFRISKVVSFGSRFQRTVFNGRVSNVMPLILWPQVLSVSQSGWGYLSFFAIET